MTARRHRSIPTPLGTYLLAAEGEAIIGLWREAQAHFPPPAALGTLLPADEPDAVLDRAAAQLDAYLAGEREDFDLPLAAPGTDFQHRVWERLRAIPRGRTTTYGTIAQEIGSPRAAQAVGAAVGRNPISIIVPCHRVLGGDGRLTGYAGGTEVKAALLRLEGALTS